jgi:hypothetical protein
MRLVKLILEPVIEGVPGVPSVYEEADMLRARFGDNAFNEVVENKWREEAGMRDTMAAAVMAAIPVLGLSAGTIKELFWILRSVALVAVLSGYDVTDPETRALMLTCAFPESANDGEQTDGKTDTFMSDVAWSVARVSSGVLGGRPGLMLWDAGFNVWERRNEASKESNRAAIRIAVKVFAPVSRTQNLWWLVLYAVFTLLPVALSLTRFVMQHVIPKLQSQINISGHQATGIFGIWTVVVVPSTLWIRRHKGIFYDNLTSCVFIGHSLLPFMAMLLATLEIFRGVFELVWCARSSEATISLTCCRQRPG